MIKDVLSTKVCMFYELLEIIIPFGLCYLHLDLFQFLHRCLSLHVQFCIYVFDGKIAPQFLKTVSIICMYLETHLAFTSHTLVPHYNLLLCVSEHYSNENSKFWTVSQTFKNGICLVLAEQVNDPCN